MPVKFEQLEKGDTVTYNGRVAHLIKNTRTEHYERGTTLQVKKMLPAGIIAQDSEGHEAEFYFQHGADKLDYTKDTLAAIKKRQDFRVKQAQADAEEAADPRDAHIAALKDQVAELRGILQDVQKQLVAQQPGKTNN